MTLRRIVLLLFTLSTLTILMGCSTSSWDDPYAIDPNERAFARRLNYANQAWEHDQRNGGGATKW